jgi:molecular chaperone DnaK (HSP70)
LDVNRYIIGIDLGTTNCAVSYVDLADEGASDRIKTFKIPQPTRAGEFSALPVLPSFLYIPGEYDLGKEAVVIPWNTGDDRFAGSFARDHGAEVPARLVASAKSWLCHANADRRAKILPWSTAEGINRVSPVEAAASYLRHIRRAWNHARGDDPELWLENQVVTVTVPASFDQVARDLTIEASVLAGLGNVTLLEEPLAAFYSWLSRHEKDWARYVRPGELILVCDVGGGTTDFTLITLAESEGTPRFERIAVGDHLILGGDNVDLALARLVETQWGQKKSSLSPDRWKNLCHLCRQAKETLLNGEADVRKISLMGKGKKLIAGTLSASLRREEVEQVVLEGFFPVVDPEAARKQGIRKGITEFGLPYEQEPAVTRHLGWFLERHRADVERIGRHNPAPDLILFNGGSLKPLLVQERIREAIRHWFRIDNSELPRPLENLNLDLAVAWGAAYYGLVKAGRGVRVGSGSPRAYYLGVEKNTGDSPLALCVVERGLDEGSRIDLVHHQFDVLANQPVSFDLYSSSFRSGDRCGDLTAVDESLTALPPLHTVVQFGKKGVQRAIPVQIEAEYTEMGTLLLWCRSTQSGHRWRLQFQLRDTGPQAGVSDEEVFDDAVVQAVCQAIRGAFTKTAGLREMETLVKEISTIVDRPREKWPLQLIRKMSDELLDRIELRGNKREIEIRWLNLMGFCLRPGFGDAFDSHRIKQLWKIYKNGPIHANTPQIRSEWWVMWRRAAGGLMPGQQRQFIQDLTPVVFGKKGGRNRLSSQERLEVWMAVANMELLSIKDKIKWGQQLVSELNFDKSPPQYFWSLSRIGARELFYGPVDRVIPADAASEWIRVFLEREWGAAKPICAALAQIARMTGDRLRDLDPGMREKVITRLSSYDFTGPYIRMLTDVVPVEKQEESVIFGESLPSGLRLRS